MEEKKEQVDTQEETAKQETAELSSEEIAQLAEKAQKADEYMDKFLRVSAEFDNFRKRTAREKETLFSDGQAACVTEFLPLLDSMEHALTASGDTSDEDSIKQGVEMIGKQLAEILKTLSVEEIPAEGEQFDPELHNAVMHIEDEQTDSNTIVEQFQKGYTMKGRVLRHSMVKVAN